MPGAGVSPTPSRQTSLFCIAHWSKTIVHWLKPDYLLCLPPKICVVLSSEMFLGGVYIPNEQNEHFTADKNFILNMCRTKRVNYGQLGYRDLKECIGARLFLWGLGSKILEIIRIIINKKLSLRRGNKTWNLKKKTNKKITHIKASTFSFELMKYLEIVSS